MSCRSSIRTTVRAKGKTKRFANQKSRPATGITQKKDKAANDIAAMPRATAVARKAAISGPAVHAKCSAYSSVVHNCQREPDIKTLQGLDQWLLPEQCLSTG